MIKHYHFIGIGGIGMGALATLVLKKGGQVSGSDLRENQMVLHLRQHGARITVGHAAENVAGADCVIFSSAVRPDNPEIVEAQRRGIPVLPRAQLLADLMEGHVGITVAGAHGKTTTTSMISHMLIKAGLQPTTAIGGIVSGGLPPALAGATSTLAIDAGYQASLGKGTYFVAEVDESDGSFLKFSPQYSIITNIDFEHVDYFQNWENILAAWLEFIHRTRPDGLLVVCGDDPYLPELVKNSPCAALTYGFGPHNDIVARDVRYDQCSTEFDCFVKGRPWGKVRLRIPGKHNVANAMAAIGLGTHLQIPADVILGSLGEYTGAQRRFQIKSTAGDVWVVDDYAHHPTEIKATLAAARQAGRKRVITVFQPHRYTRVQHLWSEMAKSFTDTDYLVLTDIYAASEKPIEGITAQRLVEEIAKNQSSPAVYLPRTEIVPSVLEVARPGDLVVMMGAGDITYLADELAKARELLAGQFSPGKAECGAAPFGRVGVLMGGYSSEREISLKSGRAIAEALRRQGCDVVAIDITVKDRQKILYLLRANKIDIAFIALHGRMGEDGTIQSILEELGIVYAGSGVEASRLAIDKVIAQDLFQKKGINVAAHISLSGREIAHHEEIIQSIDFYPVVVKPAREGSSIGIALARDPQGLKEALQKAWRYDDKVLIEQYIKGREFTVGILEEKPLPVIEIRPKAEFFDFDSKYSAGMSEYVVPARIPEKTARGLQETALAAHQAIGCRDLSRIDFILAEDGTAYVLEVNTIPGFTATSLLPKAAKVVGIDFDQLCMKLASLAYGKKKKTKDIG